MRYSVSPWRIILIVIASFIGAISHERDMYNEYKNTGTLEHTSWVSDWRFE